MHNGLYRMLVTGSRRWTDRDAIRRALAAVLRKLGVPADRIVVVHGGARGADMLADAVARELGMLVECHPVTRGDWDRHGTSAGHRRNQRMVDLGAVGCIAFPRGVSAGTRGCMAAAERAGISVWNLGDR